MDISFQRFAQLTALIAAGGSIAVACTVNSVENNQIEPEGGSDSGTGGSSGNTGSTTSAGTNGTNGGASNAAGVPATAGAPGAAGTNAAAGSSSELVTAGTSATVAGSAGVAGSTATTATAGQTFVTGNAGSAGRATGTSAAGAGGATVAGGAAFAGGTAAVAGSPGAAGNVGVAGSGTTSCVASDPAEESMGYDCSSLPYYDEECPDPSGEGLIGTVGAKTCEWYADGRVESVKILTDCLRGLSKPAGGWCGAEHEIQVANCIAPMTQKTCASTAAQSACATYKAQCSGLTLAACVGTLSALSDDDIASIEPCMESIGLLPNACDTMLNRCTVHVDHPVSVDTACAALKNSCSAVDLTTCRGALDYNSTGMSTEMDYKVEVPLCMAFDQQYEGDTCGQAFAACVL